MNDLIKLLQIAPEIEGIIGYTFQRRELLAQAFIHRSYLNENRDVGEHNERLEFLGDAVLGLIISSHLFRLLPHGTEGELSNLRSQLIDSSSCTAYIEKLQLGKYLLLSKGERLSDGRGRGSILANLFEALVGAIYLDGGFEAAQHFFYTHYDSHVSRALQLPAKNPKASLQDYCQKEYRRPPSYQLLNETGPEHARCFEVAVTIDDRELGRGSGYSKKEAQNAAAADALAKGWAATPPQLQSFYFTENHHHDQ